MQFFVILRDLHSKQLRVLQMSQLQKPQLCVWMVTCKQWYEFWKKSPVAWLQSSVHFTFKNSALFSQIVFMRFVKLSEQTAIPPYGLNSVVTVMETQCFLRDRNWISGSKRRRRSVADVSMRRPWFDTAIRVNNIQDPTSHKTHYVFNNDKTVMLYTGIITAYSENNTKQQV